MFQKANIVGNKENSHSYVITWVKSLSHCGTIYNRSLSDWQPKAVIRKAVIMGLIALITLPIKSTTESLLTSPAVAPPADFSFRAASLWIFTTTAILDWTDASH